VNAQSPRLVRGVILAGLLLVGVSIAWTYRRPGRSEPPTPGPSASGSATPAIPLPEGASRTQNLVLQNFKDGSSTWKLNAGEMVGKEGEEYRLRQVNLQFQYTAKGEKHQGTIAADEAVLTPTVEKGVFQGHVKLTTDDGAELATEQLVYRGDKKLAKSELPTAFKRGTLSGTSKGFEYESEEGRLDLPADVVIHVAPEGRPPLDIKSVSARLVRGEGQGTMQFEGGVQVDQAQDRLTTDRFELDFGEDNVVYRARAIENVVLQTSSAATPGAQAGGTRHLTCRKLDLWFRPDSSLEGATAVDDAVLTLSPAPKEPPERRRLAAGVLTFKFDQAGRIESLETLKGTTFTATPLPPNKAAVRTLVCQRLTAEVDPETGQPKLAEFTKDVAFTQGKQKATGQRAYFDGAKSELFISESPQLLDGEQGSDLTAQGILIGTKTGDIGANEQVRHVINNPKGKKGEGGFLGHGGEPLLLTSRFLLYTAKTRVARYWEGALLRTGGDEVRASELRLFDVAAGGRKLEAEGSVISSLQPRTTSKTRPPAPVEARAAKMVYEEAKREVTYDGDVAIKQGDIATRSPQARLLLSADGQKLESLKAGEPVEVVQGKRKARGSHGTYTPADETMVLTGEKVVLQDPGQEVEGRSLTFRVGDETVLVDGQEQVRTQTIIRSRQEPPVK
jgi:lipopolysaccharide transport protein LptA/LPS export ABC transporter protein LptC